MLQLQQQWCPRCGRYEETEQKHTRLSKRSNLVKVITICKHCRTTLSSRTVSASALEQKEAETPADQTEG